MIVGASLNIFYFLRAKGKGYVYPALAGFFLGEEKHELKAECQSLSLENEIMTSLHQSGFFGQLLRRGENSQFHDVSPQESPPERDLINGFRAPALPKLLSVLPEKDEIFFFRLPTYGTDTIFFEAGRKTGEEIYFSAAAIAKRDKSDNFLDMIPIEGVAIFSARDETCIFLDDFAAYLIKSYDNLGISKERAEFLKEKIEELKTRGIFKDTNKLMFESKMQVLDGKVIATDATSGQKRNILSVCQAGSADEREQSERLVVQILNVAQIAALTGQTQTIIYSPQGGSISSISSRRRPIQVLEIDTGGQVSTKIAYVPADAVPEQLRKILNRFDEKNDGEFANVGSHQISFSEMAEILIVELGISQTEYGLALAAQAMAFDRRKPVLEVNQSINSVVPLTLILPISPVSQTSRDFLISSLSPTLISSIVPTSPEPSFSSAVLSLPVLPALIESQTDFSPRQDFLLPSGESPPPKISWPVRAVSVYQPVLFQRERRERTVLIKPPFAADFSQDPRPPHQSPAYIIQTKNEFQETVENELRKEAQTKQSKINEKKKNNTQTKHQINRINKVYQIDTKHGTKMEYFHVLKRENKENSNFVEERRKKVLHAEIKEKPSIKNSTDRKESPIVKKFGVVADKARAKKETKKEINKKTDKKFKIKKREISYQYNNFISKNKPHYAEEFKSNETVFAEDIVINAVENDNKKSVDDFIIKSLITLPLIIHDKNIGQQINLEKIRIEELWEIFLKLYFGIKPDWDVQLGKGSRKMAIFETGINKEGWNWAKSTMQSSMQFLGVILICVLQIYF